MPNPADPKAIDISPEAVAQVSASLRKSRDSIHFDCGGDCDGERRVAADLLEALNAKLAETIRDRDYARDACAGMVDAANGLGRELKETRSKLAEAERERDGLRAALQITTPSARFGDRFNRAWTLLCRIARHDWLDDPTEVRRALDSFVEEAIELTLHPDEPTHGYVDALADAKAERDSALSELAKAKATLEEARR